MKFSVLYWEKVSRPTTAILQIRWKYDVNIAMQYLRESAKTLDNNCVIFK